MVDSEDDSDIDTGFYSDGEEEPSSKRRSLLVALRWVFVWVNVDIRPLIVDKLLVNFKDDDRI